MRLPGGPPIWKTRLWRLWCGARWCTDTILIFSMCSTTLVFPVEHFGPVLRGDFGSPSAPWAQNFLKAPLCGAEALRALRAPNRPGLTAAQQPLRARTARRTHPERAARTESGRAPPSGPERCNRTIAAPDGDLRPLLPCACAHLDWDAVTLSGEDQAPPSLRGKPSRPCQTVGFS